MIAQCFGDRAEDHTGFGQLFLEGGDHRHAVEDRVDRDAVFRAFHAEQDILLLERNAQLLEVLQDLLRNIIDAVILRAGLGFRVIVNVLEIDRRIFHFRPVRLLHGLPALERLEAPVQHPAGLALLGRNETDRLLAQPLGREVLLDRRGEAVLVLVGFEVLDVFDGFLDRSHISSPLSGRCFECGGDTRVGLRPGSHEGVCLIWC